MRRIRYLLLPGLFVTQVLYAQTTKPSVRVIVNEKLISRFISQTSLLRTAATELHFKKKAAPVEDWLAPAPGDKWVTYYTKGDTLVFYLSSRKATLFRCSLANAARYSKTVPFLASTKDVLFAGKRRAQSTFAVTEAAINGQYELNLTFQNNRIRRLFFNVDMSSW